MNKNGAAHGSPKIYPNQSMIQAKIRAGWQTVHHLISNWKIYEKLLQSITFSEYQYAPLATPSTIRVIKIEKKKVNGEVSCVIRHVDQIEFESKYEALSYVWGNSIATRHIYVRNKAEIKHRFPIHENLWRFLNWAWDQQMFGRWIWTDRLSLNQNDAQEIAEQVPRMGDIYSRAKQVLSWLGMSEEDGKHMAYLEQFSKENIPGTPLPEEMRLVTDATQHHQYWNRVWIAQEVVKARCVTVIIGNHQIGLQTLQAISDVSRNRSRVGITMDRLSWLRSCKGNCDLWGVLELAAVPEFECGRPQDRVYGFLGLVTAKKDGASPLQHLQVSYDKSGPEVILDAILESHPSPRNLRNYFLEPAGLLLGKNRLITEPLFDLFERYLESKLTSERHKELTTLMIKACSALNIILNVTESHPGAKSLFDSFKMMLTELDKRNFEPDAKERAIIMGVGLAIGFSSSVYPDLDLASMFESWKVRQKNRRLVPSSWRCAAHVLPRSNGKHTRLIEACAPLWARDDANLSDRVVKACGEYKDDGSCDSSTMNFEIVDVGFRFTIDRTLAQRTMINGVELHFNRVKLYMSFTELVARPKEIEEVATKKDTVEDKVVNNKKRNSSAILKFASPSRRRTKRFNKLYRHPNTQFDRSNTLAN